MGKQPWLRVERLPRDKSSRRSANLLPVCMLGASINCELNSLSLFLLEVTSSSCHKQKSVTYLLQGGDPSRLAQWNLIPRTIIYSANLINVKSRKRLAATSDELIKTFLALIFRGSRLRRADLTLPAENGESRYVLSRHLRDDPRTNVCKLDASCGELSCMKFIYLHEMQRRRCIFISFSSRFSSVRA